ncbi:hypothetical protein DSO57_1010038 [Entomophthora muscae]|uniref:Uncharacterized protein n=1 Tax=Entomophthora muscae TaxID=34485 RepID=A0ACC2RXR7_9FUNG|nr:hypothetical protein DSO57_1010038 [Entomophthora muscae]
MILYAVLAGVVWWLGNVVYSLFFSPLRHLPSPLIFQVFPIYLQIRMAMGDAPFMVHAYYLKYGPVFRMGWKLVFFVDATASKEIYSTYKFNKTTDYDMFCYFGPNVLSTQDRTQHSARRRRIAPAFTKQSVAAMEPSIIQAGVAPLLANLAKAAKTESSIDIFHQLHFFSWDVIGQLVFGESFRMLELGSHPAVQWLDAIVVFGVVGILFPFLRRFKIPAGEKLRKFSNELLDRHYKRKAEEPSHVTQGDIISHFTHPASNVPLDRQEVLAETFVQLFAGTDSTSNTLTWFFYLVLSHPRVEKKLMAELNAHGLLGRTDILNTANSNLKLPYLEATLKESMRFFPVVPNTPFRIVPEGGRKIMGHFLPEGVSLY